MLQMQPYTIHFEMGSILKKILARHVRQENTKQNLARRNVPSVSKGKRWTSLFLEHGLNANAKFAFLVHSNRQKEKPAAIGANADNLQIGQKAFRVVCVAPTPPFQSGRKTLPRTNMIVIKQEITSARL